MPAYSRRTVAEFLAADAATIVGELITAASAEGFADHRHRQTDAWHREIAILKDSFTELVQGDSSSDEWSLLLEYPIPRRQRRVDTVLLARDLVFVIEFKTEEKKHTASTRRQAEDYALDLRDFHEQSRARVIIPIAVAPQAGSVEPRAAEDDDLVRKAYRANSADLALIIRRVFDSETRANRQSIDPRSWDQSIYRPVPTIIEAATALYAGHNVREIAHLAAGVTNLTTTSERLVEIIREARNKSQKVICFVTGVPGAGKTLAGLNVVHNPEIRADDIPSPVFLSGNGPLVKIVSAAIARDRRRRGDASDASRTVSTFIQNVHHFVRHAEQHEDEPPHEKVIVFDEAQRAWNAHQSAKKKRGDYSEPTAVLRIMDRHRDWAAIIALIGGGQEINSGEAGIEEWGRSLSAEFAHWRIAVSPNSLVGDASLAGHRLFPDAIDSRLAISEEPALHLNVSIRSFRAEKITRWVEAVLNCDAAEAAFLADQMAEFPIRLSRSLDATRFWLREHVRGLRRCGLIASSGGIRLRADGIEVSSGFRLANRDLYTHWFLADLDDVRASNQLEVAATEFECQGLELDWTGVCWSGDVSFESQTSTWRYQTFIGRRWCEVPQITDRAFMLNTYRVLLSRAREGMVIWVPPGDPVDPTRLPERLDSTAVFLELCGAQLLS